MSPLPPNQRRVRVDADGRRYSRVRPVWLAVLVGIAVTLTVIAVVSIGSPPSPAEPPRAEPIGTPPVEDEHGRVVPAAGETSTPKPNPSTAVVPAAGSEAESEGGAGPAPSQVEPVQPVPTEEATEESTGSSEVAPGATPSPEQ